MKTKMKQRGEKDKPKQVREEKPKRKQRVLLGCCPVGLLPVRLLVEELPTEGELIPDKTAE